MRRCRRCELTLRAAGRCVEDSCPGCRKGATLLEQIDQQGRVAAAAQEYDGTGKLPRLVCDDRRQCLTDVVLRRLGRRGVVQFRQIALLSGEGDGVPVIDSECSRRQTFGATHDRKRWRDELH